MASVAVARFGGALRSSGAAARTMRSLAGPSPLARAGWVAGGGNKRCMSTVYSESHEYLIQVRQICSREDVMCFPCRASPLARDLAPVLQTRQSC